MVRGRIENQERNTCTSRLIPRKLLQRGFKRRVHCFRIIAAIISILLSNEISSHGNILGEVMMSSEVIIALVAVEHGSRTQRDIAFRARVVNDIAKIRFEELNLVFH